MIALDYPKVFGLDIKYLGLKKRMTKQFLKRLAALWSILLLPIVGSQFSSEIQWDLADYSVAAFLLTATAIGIEIILKINLSKAVKFGVLIVFFLCFLLLWAELAVGIFGSPLAGS